MRLPLNVRWRLTVIFAVICVLAAGGLLVGVYSLVKGSEVPAVRPDPVGEVVWNEDAEPVVDTDDVLSGNPADIRRQIQEAAQDVHDESIATTLAAMKLWSLFGMLGVAVAAVGGGWFFAGRALKPVKVITARAEQIADSSSLRRIGLTGPPDELTRMADAFDRLLGKLQTSLAHERRLVAAVSHELRTPLANQQIALDVLLNDEDATPEDFRVTAQAVLAQSRRASESIEALLVLARVEAGMQELPRVNLDLAEVAREKLLHLRDRNAHRWHLRLEPTPYRGHPALMRRLIANLLENAVTHNLRHGEVWVDLSPASGGIELHVSSTGPRLEASVVATLAEPFLQGPLVRESSGSGLGLAIVSGIVGAHGGTLELAPRNEGGLKVSIRLAPQHIGERQ